MQMRAAAGGMGNGASSPPHVDWCLEQAPLRKQGNAAASGLTGLAGVRIFRTFGSLVHVPGRERHAMRTHAAAGIKIDGTTGSAIGPHAGYFALASASCGLVARVCPAESTDTGLFGAGLLLRRACWRWGEAVRMDRDGSRSQSGKNGSDREVSRDRDLFGKSVAREQLEGPVQGELLGMA